MDHQSFLSELKTAMQVAFFKEKDMHNVAGDKSKTPYAYYIIIGAGVLGFVGQQFFSSWFKPTITSGLLMALVQVIMMVVGIYIISFIAKAIFKGHAKHDEFFRVMAYAVIVNWVAIIPMLGIIGALWSLALMFVILKTIHKLTTGGAIGTIIVAIVIMGLIGMVTAPFYGGMYGGSMKGFGNNTFKFDSPYGETTMDMEDENTYEINIPTPDGAGNVKMEDGVMKITGPDGQVMELTIPDYE